MNEKFELISYNREVNEAHSSSSLDDLLAHVNKERISWVTMQSCQESDRSTIVKLLSFFDVDPALCGGDPQ